MVGLTDHRTPAQQQVVYVGGNVKKITIMLLIKGQRTARIKSYSENHEKCRQCGAFDLSVAVFRDYYHLFFIPFLPIGPKNVKILCSSCGESFGSATLSKQYEETTRTPIYLYTIPLLFPGLVILAVYANLTTQDKKADFVRNPIAGDVYLIRTDKGDTTSYSFLKVIEVKGDTLVLYHNNGVYSSFTTSLDINDSFVTNEQLILSKLRLRQMLDSDEINTVIRK